MEKLSTLGVRLAGNQPPDFIVWGDSHAMALRTSLDSFAQARRLSGVIAARQATVPLLGVWRPNYKLDSAGALDWNVFVLEYIRENRTKKGAARRSLGG